MSDPRNLLANMLGPEHVPTDPKPPVGSGTPAGDLVDAWAAKRAEEAAKRPRRARLSVVTTKPEAFVFAQSEWKRCKWLPAELGTEEQLVAAGFKLAGWARSLENLSEAEALRMTALCRMTRDLTPEEQREQDSLLGRCPFRSDRLHFGDFDVMPDVPSYDPKTAPLQAAAFAEAFAAVAPQFGLGVPAWARSNTRGGLHAIFGAPLELVVSDVLPEALGLLVRRAAEAAHVILRSQQATEVKDRAHAVHLDDGVFAGHVEKRARVWRLRWLPKPGGIYEPVVLVRGSIPRTVALGAWGAPVPVDAAALRAACAEVLAARRAEAAQRAADHAAALERIERVREARARAGLPPGSPWPERYVEVAIGEILNLNASPGGRHDAVNAAAFALGRLAGGGAPGAAAALPLLLQNAIALLGSGREREARKTVENGFEDGQRNPATPPVNDEDPGFEPFPGYVDPAAERAAAEKAAAEKLAREQEHARASAFGHFAKIVAMQAVDPLRKGASALTSEAAPARRRVREGFGEAAALSVFDDRFPGNEGFQRWAGSCAECGLRRSALMSSQTLTAAADKCTDKNVYDRRVVVCGEFTCPTCGPARHAAYKMGLADMWGKELRGLELPGIAVVALPLEGRDWKDITRARTRALRYLPRKTRDSVTRIFAPGLILFLAYARETLAPMGEKDGATPAVVLVLDDVMKLVDVVMKQRDGIFWELAQKLPDDLARNEVPELWSSGWARGTQIGRARLGFSPPLTRLSQELLKQAREEAVSAEEIAANRAALAAIGEPVRPTHCACGKRHSLRWFGVFEDGRVYGPDGGWEYPPDIADLVVSDPEVSSDVLPAAWAARREPVPI